MKSNSDNMNNDKYKPPYRQQVAEIIEFIKTRKLTLPDLVDACGDILINQFHNAPPDYREYITEVIQCILINTIAHYETEKKPDSNQFYV
jgi:hypothetical protein